MRQVIRTSVAWRYEVQQIDVRAQVELSAVEVYLSLEGLQNDSITTGINTSEISWPQVGVSLLGPDSSAADLTTALASLPSAGDVKVARVPSAVISDPTVASRHLVTFLSRGGDVPLLGVEEWTITEAYASVDRGGERCESEVTTDLTLGTNLFQHHVS